MVLIIENSLKIPRKLGFVLFRWILFKGFDPMVNHQETPPFGKYHLCMQLNMVG